jgi:lipopolysaccharide biosynthesis regulator YciM
MMPERRDVRRTLAENYVQLGLLDEAREELRRLASEWDSERDAAARDEVLARHMELG